MPLHAKNKGAGGEREIADMLNNIIAGLMVSKGGSMEIPQVQRNQNQSAVGGCDLIGTYHFAIEVKRQEALSVEAWWKQCVKSAADMGQIPVLIYRQNRKKWRVMMPGLIGVSALVQVTTRVETELDSFLRLFELVARNAL